ncbi:hypothetical protein [Thermaerobacillus caldiproteolyticus]|uniref:Uncharacterized protein n=1 Tax=Thermaerobacillus caldiproteolyticus TaxID=247480 RepID=A0A7W0C0T6_9BACL|nr:hypothetical protein [Anoxybacillus caldiproteolyticus]MBA2875844.1 hypothetical protein [Anoxybacillus caldiproteolyticus]
MITEPFNKDGQPACYPYKKKKYFNTKWAKDGFKVYENEKIELSMGIYHGKQEKPIVLYASHLPKGTIKEIECCYGLRKQKVVEGVKLSIGMMPLLLTEFIEKVFDTVIDGRRPPSSTQKRSDKKLSPLHGMNGMRGGEVHTVLRSLNENRHLNQ